MEATMKTIKLSGVLASKFGHRHRIAVASPAEAIRALCVMIPGFEKFLMNAKDRNLFFAVFVGRDNLKEDQLRDPTFSEDEIRFTPIVGGSKKGGVLNIIAGIVLIAVGAVVQYAMGGAPNMFSNYLYGAGISMIVGGVIQLLSPSPKIKSGEKTENEKSYIFNGAINTQAQGNPVPVLYGELMVGSAVISAGISAKDNFGVPTTGAGATGTVRGGGGHGGNVDERFTNVLA